MSLKKPWKTDLEKIYAGFIALKEKGFPLMPLHHKPPFTLLLNLIFLVKQPTAKRWRFAVLRNHLPARRGQTCRSSFLCFRQRRSFALVPPFSVGTCRTAEIPPMLLQLEKALEKLNSFLFTDFLTGLQLNHMALLASHSCAFIP